MMVREVVLLCLMCALFFVADCLQNDYCKQSVEYNGQTFLHTVCSREKQRCGPDTKMCGPDFKVIKFNDNLRQFLLDLHNDLRNKVAMGKENRGKQPPAGDMMVLKYNRELEFIAQCWANACKGNPLVHDVTRSTNEFEYVGQNLGFYNRSDANIDVKNVLKNLTLQWYDEVTQFKREWVNYTDDRGPNVKVGHYTQLLWSDTTDLGCAASYYTTKTKFANKTRKWHHLLYVCNYGPGGNYITLPVYKVGKPGSKCPGGMKTTKKYPGLCGVNKKINETSRNFEPLFTF